LVFGSDNDNPDVFEAESLCNDMEKHNTGEQNAYNILLHIFEKFPNLKKKFTLWTKEDGEIPERFLKIPEYLVVLQKNKTTFFTLTETRNISGNEYEVIGVIAQDDGESYVKKGKDWYWFKANNYKKVVGLKDFYLEPYLTFYRNKTKTKPSLSFIKCIVKENTNRFADVIQNLFNTNYFISFKEGTITSDVSTEWFEKLNNFFDMITTHTEVIEEMRKLSKNFSEQNFQQFCNERSFKCKRCGNTDNENLITYENSGDTVCFGEDRSGCGTVVEDHYIFQGDPNQVYTDKDGEKSDDKSQHGTPYNPLFSEDYNYNLSQNYNKKDRLRKKYYDEIDSIAHPTINFNKCEKDYAKHLLNANIEEETKIRKQRIIASVMLAKIKFYEKPVGNVSTSTSWKRKTMDEPVVDMDKIKFTKWSDEKLLKWLKEDLKFEDEEIKKIEEKYKKKKNIRISSNLMVNIDTIENENLKKALIDIYNMRTTYEKHMNSIKTTVKRKKISDKKLDSDSDDSDSDS
jgi:hypothetical protein